MSSLRVIKWEKPTRGRYKCNIDASFTSQCNRVGIGEALGLLHAIWWVHVLQLGSVDFAMDSKTVVDHFHNKETVLTEVENVLKECNRMFSLLRDN
ncbi:cytochrome P450 [Trifolium medium]|uniref:Cytochrome P450 n=1 Tax=Trifolium medium TaxID=97028 RepID=A0A392N847_9FABA|nr:cytochrome P450 [Trifolium medium]